MFEPALNHTNRCGLNIFENQNAPVSNFRRPNKVTLRKLCRVASKYLFLVNNTASLERVFSFYNKRISFERKYLEAKTLSDILFMLTFVNYQIKYALARFALTIKVFSQKIQQKFP